MKLGTLIRGYTPKGAVCCNDPAHTAAHGLELWDRDISGRCSSGGHELCAHSDGGPQQAGVPLDGGATWHCGCDCHLGQPYKPWRDKWLAAAHRERLAAAGPSQLELFRVAS